MENIIKIIEYFSVNIDFCFVEIIEFELFIKLWIFFSFF